MFAVRTSLKQISRGTRGQYILRRQSFAKMIFTPEYLVFLAILTASTAAQNFQENNVCGAVYSRKQFMLQSPNYSNSVRCFYYLKGENCPTHYVFQLLDFHLEDSLGCTRVRLEIEDQDALCGTKTGVKSYYSASGDLNLTFISADMNLGQFQKFQILVTRLPCNSGEPQGLTPGPSNHRSLPNCCASSYALKNFYISSAGFPYSKQPDADCVYTIRKASIDVCRIRINFIYFNIGEYDSRSASCIGGYIEIDGKKLCGCHTGMKLTTSFENERLTKSIHFKSEDVLTNELKGFVIEIIQDECPTKYETYDVVKHVYFFAPPDENYNNSTNYNPGIIDPRREREETTYLDTSTLDFNVFDRHDKSSCAAWKSAGIALLDRDPLWQSMTHCGVPKISESVGRNCVELSSLKGYFRSPGYPYYYPSNLNLCYRYVSSSIVYITKISKCIAQQIRNKFFSFEYSVMQ